MKEAGWKEIPVRVVDWPEDKQREFVIKDNVSGGDWDWDLLANDWDIEQLSDWGLELPADFGIDGEVEEDEAPEVDEQNPAVSQLGEIYRLGRHKVMCGDSTDADAVAELMDGAKADMVFTDPPYNVDYQGGSTKRDGIKNDNIENFYQFLVDCFSCAYGVMADKAAIYIAHSELERENFQHAFREAGFTFSSLIVWVKNNSTFHMSKDYKWKHEPIIYGWKGTHEWYGPNTEDSVWTIDRPSRSEEHPTMKPIALVARAIKNSSKGNQNVLDIFGGSGSTLIACEQTNRTCYMMELDPKYCDVIRKRFAKFIGKEENWQEITSVVSK
jgi:DNA modification methylase